MSKKLNKVFSGIDKHGTPYSYKVKSIVNTKMTEGFQEFIDELNSFQFIKDCGGVTKQEEFGLINQLKKQDTSPYMCVESINNNIYKLWDQDFGSITLYPKGNGVELFRLEIYNQGRGYGSKMLQLFNHISCKLDVPMTLSPGAPGNRDEYKNEGDQDKRILFYERNGFCKTDNHYIQPRMSNQCTVDQYYNDEIDLPTVDLTDIVNSKEIVNLRDEIANHLFEGFDNKEELTNAWLVKQGEHFQRTGKYANVMDEVFNELHPEWRDEENA